MRTPRDITLFALSNFRRMGKASPGIYVLAYHSVADADRAQFAKQLQYLRGYGDFLSLDDAVVAAENCAANRSRYFCLTFDDGDRSLMTNVLPVLVEHNTPAAAFLITDRVGGEGRAQSDDTISIPDCRTLLENKVTLGSHSASHPVLARLSEGQVREEMLRSKRFVEETFHVACNHFACPWGLPARSYRPDVEPYLAMDVGYRTFFTTVRGALLRSSQLSECPRHVIEPHGGLYQLQYFLGG